jgi:MSHA biogenesis protein MshP
MFLNVSKLSNVKTNFANTQTKQGGSSLVIAIFIIVIISMLGAALVKMIRTSSDSIVYEVLGTRAYNAAQIGLQWQLQQLFPLNNTNQLTCAAVANTPPDLSTISGLENCEIISPITCTDLEVLGTHYYTVRSSGQCEVAGVITSRTLEVQARAL